MNRRSFVFSLIGAFAAAAVVKTGQAEAAPAAPVPVAPPVPDIAAVDAETQARLDAAQTADSQYYYRRRYRPVRRVYYRRPVRRVYYRRPVRRVYYRRPVRRAYYRFY
jgi:hypothetical protein